MPPPRNPRPEDFPELGSKGDRRRPSHNEREEKENKLRPNYQIDDDNRNYSGRKRTSMRQISDRRDSDRRDGDRRDGDRRESDRRDDRHDDRHDNRHDDSRSHRQNDRYPSSNINFTNFFIPTIFLNYFSLCEHRPW